MQVADYAKTRDFYAGVLGMTVSDDDKKNQCRLSFDGNQIIARNASSHPGGKIGIDHWRTHWPTGTPTRASSR